jgi:2'-5' RNA ligase
MPAHADGPTAIVIPLPAAEPAVRRWRDRYDPSAAQGMPAHITVLYPFLPEAQISAHASRTLARLFAGHPRFDILLAGCARFPGGVLYLAPQPANPLRALTAAVTETWPQAPPYGGMFDEVVPHLTVATKVEPEVADRIEQQLAPALPITAVVTEAWLYAPNGSHWEPRHRLPLGPT